MSTGSLYLAVAREDATGRLAGLIRAVGDGVSISYIQDLLIYPDFQKSRLGSRLLDRVRVELTIGTALRRASLTSVLATPSPCNRRCS